MSPTLRHVQHCNVNCRDLDRSLAFYRDELGLTPTVRTNPEPQDGSGFGIDGPAQWDAWMMSDGRANPVIDLLEWKTPAPVAGPHGRDALGMVALRIAVGGLRHARTTTDPDGTALELVPADETRLLGVVLQVSDLAASTAWYTDVLGLEQHGDALVVPGDDFEIHLRPGPAGEAAAASANQLGIYRMAFLVDDAPAAVAAVRAAGAACPDPVLLDMGPTIPIDGLWAVFFPDPDGACMEFIQATAPVG